MKEGRLTRKSSAMSTLRHRSLMSEVTSGLKNGFQNKFPLGIKKAAACFGQSPTAQLTWSAKDRAGPPAAAANHVLAFAQCSMRLLPGLTSTERGLLCVLACIQPEKPIHSAIQTVALDFCTKQSPKAFGAPS
eukprot:1140066-Pelagomonas_calceolata.AAC.2